VDWGCVDALHLRRFRYSDGVFGGFGELSVAKDSEGLVVTTLQCLMRQCQKVSAG
jgi:hypothetical protein